MAKYKKPGVILFFIADFTPSSQETAYADTLNGTIRFRNRAYVNDTDAIEEGDFVAGFAVPRSYLEAETKDGGKRFKYLAPPAGLTADAEIEAPTAEDAAPRAPATGGPGPAPGKAGKPATWNPNTPPA